MIPPLSNGRNVSRELKHAICVLVHFESAMGERGLITACPHFA